ncbi:hypothetical protein Tco_0121742 [Tanacetum coccineum]
MNSSLNNASMNVHECEKYLKLETEHLNKKDFVEKEIYNKLFRSFTTLEKYCISLEVDTQLNQGIFQRDSSVSNQSAPSFDQFFELNELKAQSQEKDTVIKKLKERIKSLSGKINEDKIKKDLEEIETINIKLDHRVSKLIAENEHLKQTYKQLYDSIKPACIRSKEQCDGLINQVNLKSVEISNLNTRLQEKVLVITTLKDELKKLKGKDLVDNTVTKHTIDPEMLTNDVEPITPKLLNNRTDHSAYIKHTQEEVVNSKVNANSKLLCVKCNGCMLSDNHDLCVLDFINDVNACAKSKSVKKIGNACLLTRITIIAEVPLRKPTTLETDTPKPNVLVSKPKIIKSISANNKEPIVAPEPATSTGSPSLTTVDQDAPSPSNSQTAPETQSPVISNVVVEENHDLDVAHMSNDPFFGIPIPENDSEASSSLDVIPTIVHIGAPNSEHVTKWTKDLPLDNIIDELEKPISTRLQLHEQANINTMIAFLTSVDQRTKKTINQHVGLKQGK